MEKCSQTKLRRQLKPCNSNQKDIYVQTGHTLDLYSWYTRFKWVEEPYHEIKEGDKSRDSDDSRRTTRDNGSVQKMDAITMIEAARNRVLEFQKRSRDKRS